MVEALYKLKAALNVKDIHFLIRGLICVWSAFVSSGQNNAAVLFCSLWTWWPLFQHVNPPRVNLLSFSGSDLLHYFPSDYLWYSAVDKDRRQVVKALFGGSMRWEPRLSTGEE